MRAIHHRHGSNSSPDCGTLFDHLDCPLEFFGKQGKLETMELRLHADDLKQLEDMFARALSRAIMTAARLLAKEGLLTQFSRTAEPIPEPETPPPPPKPADDTALAPIIPLAKEPTKPTKKVKPARRSILTICKTVGTRPAGYVTVHDAAKLIEGVPADSAYHQIAKWALDQEVKAVIVADNKWTPTKGLPGRLMVENNSVKSREQIRKQNIKVPAKMRQSAPKYSAV